MCILIRQWGCFSIWILAKIIRDSHLFNWDMFVDENEW